MSREVVVIGGGASGMMAAIWAAREGAKVTLLEAGERPGKKLSVTGNGRCNFSSVNDLPDAYRGENPLFAKAVLSTFTVQETVAFFTGLGIYSENIEGGLYPRSMQAQSVVTALEKEMARQKVKVKNRERVVGISVFSKEGEGIEGAARFQVKTAGWQYEADAVILAAGSPAHEETGAAGDGYALAESLGHTLVSPHPALTSLLCKEAPSYGWAGVRARGEVTALVDGEAVCRDAGELQLTEYGVSGIPVFNVSRYCVRALEEKREVRLLINFFPEAGGDLPGFWRARKNFCPQLSGKDLLLGLFPEKLAAALWKKSRGEEEALLTLISFLPLTVTGYQRERAQVYSGGVSLAEVDWRTMESLLMPGLYLCGEVTDIDGRCGGYNLQWAWSSGKIAGTHAGRGKVSPALEDTEGEGKKI